MVTHNAEVLGGIVLGQNTVKRCPNDIRKLHNGHGSALWFGICGHPGMRHDKTLPWHGLAITMGLPTWVAGG